MSASVAVRCGDCGVVWPSPSAPALIDEPPVQRLRLLGSLKQSLGDRSCRGGIPEGEASVIAQIAGREATLFRFRCDGRYARLLPVALETPAASESRTAVAVRKRRFEEALETEVPRETDITRYLEDVLMLAGRPPIAEFVRVAELRRASRQFDEALRLIELASEHASPEMRERARLGELHDFVRMERESAKGGEPAAR